MATLRNFTYTMLALMWLLIFAMLPWAQAGVLPHERSTLFHRQSGEWKDPNYDDPYYKRPGAPEGPRIDKPKDKTFSVHKSCYDKVDYFDELYRETLFMARRAVDRTKAASEGQDADFANAFALCMQNEVGDQQTWYRAPEYFMTWNDRRKLTSTELVYAVLGSIGYDWEDVSLQVVPEAHPDVRIICDGMASWVPSPVPDQANWWNEEHQVLAVNKCGPDTMGMTYSAQYTKPGQTPDPNKYRSVIVLCDGVFKDNNHIIDDMYNQGFPNRPDANPEHQDLDWFATLTSRVLLHEWTHTARYRQEDFYGTTAGWQYLVNDDFAADKRVQDADSLANLGLFASMQETKEELTDTPQSPERGGWVLDRNYDYLPPDEEVLGGELTLLKQYGDLPRVPRLEARPTIPLRPGEPPYEY